MFQRFDVDNSNSIDHGELTQALKLLGNAEVSEEDTKAVFHEADVYENGHLSEKEFIVCLILGYILGHLKITKEEESKEGGEEDAYEGKGQELRWAFNNMIGAYLLFDVDASGDLSRDEVMNQLHNKTGMWLCFVYCFLVCFLCGSIIIITDNSFFSLFFFFCCTGVFADAAVASMLSEDRWRELDWDGDGIISFREFIWAFQSWISLDGEHDEK